MLGRLSVGIVKGLLVGGLLGYALVRLGSPTPPPILAYLAAAVAGVLVGLIAGKPIWADGALVEASTKAVVGGLLGAGILAAERTWLMIPAPISLAPLVPEHALIGGFAVTALAFLAAVLGGFYEADNSPSDSGTRRASGTRLEAPRNRIAPTDRAGHETEEASQAEQKKRERG
jgi:hypothetical protein